jgi:hypothetical protein
MPDAKHIHIKRVSTSDAGTFGVVLDGFNGVPFCVSLELPYKDNKPNISCIPSGIYEGIRVDSPRFGNTFEVQGNLGERTHILFHCGNSISDSRGCLILAENFSPNNRVERSRIAFNEFMDRTENTDYFILQITETY